MFRTGTEMAGALDSDVTWAEQQHDNVPRITDISIYDEVSAAV